MEIKKNCIFLLSLSTHLGTVTLAHIQLLGRREYLRYTEHHLMKILISAGEASGDRYSAELVEALRKWFPNAEFLGCAGKRLRAAGVRPVVASEEIAVVGIFEVLAHIPRVFRALHRLAKVARQERPSLAILTDAPDFHLRLARKLKRQGVPIFYYVAPQVWAWRKGRLQVLRRVVDHLLCIFPFEEKYFRQNGIEASFVGHPLKGCVNATVSREEFFRSHSLNSEAPLIVLLPGSRRGEAQQHLEPLLGAVRRLQRTRRLNFVLPASSTTGKAFFEERIQDSSVHIIEGNTENALKYADLTLTASGTATIEAALLGVPMVVFYRVTTPSWLIGKLLVDVPFYSMVNLLGGRRIVPELIQEDCTAERLATEAERLLDNGQLCEKMRRELAEIGDALETSQPAAVRAAELIWKTFKSQGEPVA